MKNAMSAEEYGDRTTQAVYSVLIEIGQVLGAYLDRFVVIGGSVPWLLYPNAQPQHIGTMDVDLSLDAERLGEGQYAALVELLEAAGYQRGADAMRRFQMRRLVQLGDGDPVAVIVDFLRPRTTPIQRNKPPLLAEFAVIPADGADLAMQYFVEQELKGIMPDGRRNSVALRVASIPAFLVMKGYALKGRDKPKDAYDIYYAIKQYDGGTAALAEACRPLLANPVAQLGYSNIKSKFERLEDFGPTTVQRFLAESVAVQGMTPAQLQLDAFRQVSAWAQVLGV